MKLSKKQKTFSHSFAEFLNSKWNFENFEKNMSLIADVFTKSRTPKDVVRWMSKRPCFRTSFNSQHAKGSQALMNSKREHCYHIFSPLWQKWSWKMSFLMIFETLGRFVNTLTEDDKYSLHNSENLWQPLQYFLIFCSIFTIYIKFWAFWNKRWPS